AGPPLADIPDGKDRRRMSRKVAELAPKAVPASFSFFWFFSRSGLIFDKKFCSSDVSEEALVEATLFPAKPLKSCARNAYAMANSSKILIFLPPMQVFSTLQDSKSVLSGGDRPNL